MEQDFLRGSTQSQNRRVRIAAAVMAALLAIAAVIIVVVRDHERQQGKLFVSIETPYVAPGIAPGSSVLLHGVEIGKVTDLTRHGDVGVRVELELDDARSAGITDGVEIDFRPANYFGVTALNVRSAGDGSPLADGDSLARRPLGDFSMARMLERASLVVDGTINDDFVSTLDKVVRYANGLNPMIQTGITIADRIARAQVQLPSESLASLDDVLLVLPSFEREVIAGLYGLYDTRYNRLPDGSLGLNESVTAQADAGLSLADCCLFGAAGALLKSHDSELTPVVGAVQLLTDTIPRILAGGALSQRLQTLVAQYEQAMPAAGDGRTVNVRIQLDRLPALAEPFGLPIESEAAPR